MKKSKYTIYILHFRALVHPHVLLMYILSSSCTQVQYMPESLVEHGSWILGQLRKMGTAVH